MTAAYRPDLQTAGDAARLRAEAREHRDMARRLRQRAATEPDLVARLRLRSSVAERVALAQACDRERRAVIACAR